MSQIPRLHLISNRQLCSVDDFPTTAWKAASGGVDAIHLREPDLEPDQFGRLVERVVDAISGTGARVIVNRFVDVAVRLNVDGIQLSEAQLGDVRAVRSSIPAGMLMGVSVHSVESAEMADDAGADYVIAGHVFDTDSKPGTPGRGLAYIEAVSGAISIPVIGVGGITPENTGNVIRAGASGVAVMSAILTSPAPDKAAMRFQEALKQVEDNGV